MQSQAKWNPVFEWKDVGRAESRAKNKATINQWKSRGKVFKLSSDL